MKFMQKIIFLSCKNILDIHDSMINFYGGAQGIRDIGLLESAIAQPRATFAGSFVHKSIHEMAAAYFFHIIKNHAFVDGNKRTGLVSTNSFLIANGYEFKWSTTKLYQLAIDVACSKTSKPELIKIFNRSISHLKNKKSYHN